MITLLYGTVALWIFTIVGLKVICFIGAFFAAGTQNNKDDIKKAA